MQTFLPSPYFSVSASVLDRQRLGKQRVECLQILNTLDKRSDRRGWQNHPAVRMWRGYSLALIEYGEVICTEWIDRGYRDSILPKLDEMRRNGLFDGPAVCERPPWIGNDAFHASHRSNLLRKNPDHYRQFWPNDPDDLPYIWPSNE